MATTAQKQRAQKKLDKLKAQEAKPLEIINAPEEKPKSKDVTERVKTFNDVLRECKTTQAQFEKATKGLPQDEVAYRQIKMISKALNEGTKLTSNHRRYYPWFNVERAGFVFVA